MLILQPPAFEGVYHEVARHLRGAAIQREFIPLRQKNAEGNHLRFGLKVMVTGLGRHPTLSLARKWANLHSSLRIEGDAQGCWV